MPGDEDKVGHTLLKLLEYQKEHHIDTEDLLLMMGMLNLMGLIGTLNESGAAETPNNGPAGDLQSLLTPLLGMMAMGMNKGGDGAGSGQNPFNPAMMMSLLGALGGGAARTGQQPDLTGLMGLLGPLLSMAGPGMAPGSGQGQGEKSAAKGGASCPVEREINLDLKKSAPTVEANHHNQEAKTKRETLPKPGEVLEWKFGAS